MSTAPGAQLPVGSLSSPPSRLTSAGGLGQCREPCSDRHNPADPPHNTGTGTLIIMVQRGWEDLVEVR